MSEDQRSDKTNPVDVEVARVALEADRQARVKRAMTAIQMVLAQERCELRLLPQITSDGRIVAQAQIVALE